MAKAEYLYDDFSTESGKWYVSTPATGIIDTLTGTMQIVPTSGYDYVGSSETWDLTDSYFSWRLVENAPAGSGSIEVAFMANAFSGNYVDIIITGGRTDAQDTQFMYLRESVGGVVNSATVDYVPSEDIWFRIRLSGGVIYWETSVDGETWVEKRGKSTTLDLSNVEFGITGGFWDSEPDPGYATIDDFGLFDGIPVPPPPPPNAKLSTLTDNFSTQNETDWYGWDGTNVKIVSGSISTNNVLYLGCTDSYSILQTIDNYDITDDFACIYVEKNTPAGNGTNISEFSIRPDGGTDRVGINWDGDNGYIYFYDNIGGVNSQTAAVYNYDRHKWLRMRESAGIIYWDTSIDGAVWTNRRSKAIELDFTGVKVRLGTGYYGTETPSYLLLDNFNLPVGNTLSEGEVNLPATKLTDTFDTFLDTKWWTPEESTWSVVDGTLQCAINNEYWYFLSNERWDLRDSNFTIELVQNANAGTGYPGNATVQFIASIDESNSIQFMIKGGENSSSILRETVNGVRNDTTMNFNIHKHRWLRIREYDGTVYWEASSNGVVWNIYRSKITSLNLSNVRLSLISGYWDEEETDPGTIIIDNVGLPDLRLASAMGWNSSTLSFGANDGGTVQAKNYFEKADWLWNPIPDNPILDDNNDEIAYYLTYPATNNRHTISFGWYANAFIHPYQITESTPRYTVHLTWPDEHPDWNLPNPFFGYEIPIPMGTQIPPGSDGHLAVADPVTGKVFSIWQAEYHPLTDTWTGTYGGVTDLNGDGRDYIGSATATNISRYAGTARISELQAGEIPHALFCASNIIRPTTFRYPAKKTDGINMAGVPLNATIEEGTRLQLNPDIDLSSVSGILPIELAIGRAWQRYGCYVGDQGGNLWPPTFGAGQVELSQSLDYTIYDESIIPYQDIEVPEEYAELGVEWDYFSLEHIPWRDENGNSNIRVLKNWHGGA